MSNCSASFGAALRVVEPETSLGEVLGPTLSQADMVSDRALVRNPSGAHPNLGESLSNPCRQCRPALQSRFRILTRSRSVGWLTDRPGRFGELARVGGMHGVTSHFVQPAVAARERKFGTYGSTSDGLLAPILFAASWPVGIATCLAQDHASKVDLDSHPELPEFSWRALLPYGRPTLGMACTASLVHACHSSRTEGFLQAMGIQEHLLSYGQF